MIFPPPWSQEACQAPACPTPHVWVSMWQSTHILVLRSRTQASPEHSSPQMCAATSLAAYSKLPSA